MLPTTAGEREVGGNMTTSTVWLWLSFGLTVLGLSACSDDFVALIKARHATSELRGTI